MVAYKQTHLFTLKWVVGMLVFMLAMGVTFSDAEGIHLPPGNVSYFSDGTTIQTVVENNVTNYQVMSYVNFSEASLSMPDQEYNNSPTSAPTAVPEPGTLLLIGTGLAALYTLKRKNIG